MKSTQSSSRRAVPAQSTTPAPRVNPRRTVLERLTDAAAQPSQPAHVPTPATEVSDPFQGRTFRLDLVNAAEDIPRVVRCYVKHKGMECALVLRPHDGQGILVHVEGGQAWKWTGLDSDIPKRPSEPLPVISAPSLLKGVQKELPPQGPITLKGQWSGKLACDNGNPRISLQRKVASYGTLHVWSDAVNHVWRWQVDRVEKWFTQSGKQEGTAVSLAKAIRDGLANAMGLLGEACSVRDSRRRAALDPEYGEAHPIKPAREGKDPTERFQPKEPKAEKVAAATPPKSNARGRKSLGEGPVKGAGSASVPAASAPAQAPPTRRRSAQAQPAPAQAQQTTPAADVGEIDLVKDKLLLNAFGDVLDQALASLK